MNPAHRSSRFWCALRAEDLPVPSFAIVTACNPGDRLQSDSMNRQADGALAAECDQRGWARFRVVGASADLRHQEPGWGVSCGSLDQAVALGRRWGQVAIFWIENDALLLVDCEDHQSETLGSWSARTRFGQSLGPWRLEGAVP